MRWENRAFLLLTFSVTLRPKIIKINSNMSELWQDKVVTFLKHGVLFGVYNVSSEASAESRRLFVKTSLRMSVLIVLLMVALWNRAGHYIFALWFLSFLLLFFPRLISAVGDWMSTILLHMVWP